MAQENVRLRIWCEDRAHEQFVRHLFHTRFGVAKRDLTVNPAPRGKGSASQWVIAQYEQVARLARAERHQTHLGFLLVADGDNDGVRARKQAFCAASQRDRKLSLAIWVPTWSIETWVKFLVFGSSGPMSEMEQTSYKGEITPNWTALLPRAIANWQREGDAGSLPSLEDAYIECKLLPIP